MVRLLATQAIVAGALSGCTDKGSRLADLASTTTLQIGAANAGAQGPGLGVVIIPNDQATCPTLRVSSHASVDALSLDRLEIGGYVRDKGGQAGGCTLPQFTRLGSDVLVPAPTDDTVVVADDSATWTAAVANLRAQRGFVLTEPSSGHLAPGAAAAIRLTPGGETVTSAEIDFVLDADRNPDGSYNQTQFSITTQEPTVSVTGDTVGFMVPGGRAGAGQLIVRAQLAGGASRCDGVAACLVTYQWSNSAPAVMD